MRVKMSDVLAEVRAINGRFDAVQAQFVAMNARLDSTNARLDTLIDSVAQLHHDLAEHIQHHDAA